MPASLVAVPVLPVEAFVRWQAALGLRPQPRDALAAAQALRVTPPAS